jgi:hypothetical protein
VSLTILALGLPTLLDVPPVFSFSQFIEFAGWLG